MGDVKARARAARAEEPGPAAVLPERGEELLRIARVERQVGAAGPLVDVEHLGPGASAVDGLEDAALGVLSPLPPHGADPGGVGVVGVQQDPVDALGGVEPEMRPALAAVERAVDAVAHRGAVAHVALAGADPDDRRVALVERHGADRRDPLVVEDALPGEPAVLRPPDAAGGGADEHQVGVRLEGVDRRDATAHPRRPDRPGLHAGEQHGVEIRGGDAAGEREDESEDGEQRGWAHRGLRTRVVARFGAKPREATPSRSRPTTGSARPPPLLASALSTEIRPCPIRTVRVPSPRWSTSLPSAPSPPASPICRPRRARGLSPRARTRRPPRRSRCSHRPRRSPSSGRSTARGGSG